MNSSYRFSQIETAIAISLWALSFPLIKLALQEVSPLTLIVIRFSLGGGLLFWVAYRQKIFRLYARNDFIAIGGLGFIGVTVHQLLQVSGQAFSEASTAALRASTAPAIIVLLGAIFLKERLGLRQTTGVFLASAGAIVVSTGGQPTWLNQEQLLKPGSLLILLSAIIWAVYSILNRVVGAARSPLITASGMMLAGAFFCVPLWILQEGWLELGNLPPSTWVNLAVIGILCTGLAHLLYTRALQRTSASDLAAIQNIEPVIAIIAAAILLGEKIHPALITGGILILAGLFLSEKPKSSQAHPR